MIHRPLFKQLFFLQLFTFETNARQFVTKLSCFLLSVFLFLFDSHHVRASTSKKSSIWWNMFQDNPPWWSSLFNHSSASRADDPIEKLLLSETRLPLWWHTEWHACHMCKHRYALESEENQFFMPHKFLQERQLHKTSVMRWWNINKSRRKLLLQTARSNEKITCESFANNMVRMTSWITF